MRELEGRIALWAKSAKSELIKEANPKLAMFDLGNNVDHVRLKMIIPLEHAHVLTIDVNGMVN